MIYILYLLTFFIFPILGKIASKHFDLVESKKHLLFTFIVFLIHNTMFILDYSLKGDYADYLIFSFEYLFLCLCVFMFYKSTNIYARLLKFFGFTIIIVGSIQAIPGVLFFIFISQDYEMDKAYCFTSMDKKYQTRQYIFGTVGSIDTRYTFETYRLYENLPLERRLNVTDFFDLKSDLDFKNLTVNITERNNEQVILFSSPNRSKHIVVID